MSNTADIRRKLTEKDQTMFEESVRNLKGLWTGNGKKWKMF